MGLSLSQRREFERARKLGSGRQGVALDDGACRALIGIVAQDLGVSERLGLPNELPTLFGEEDPAELTLSGSEPLELFEQLLDGGPQDSDTYFTCLAELHKRRLKYQRILATQPVPTIDQVGPRGLLLYGQLPVSDLAALLLWRKWVFDIDNRAGQEAGYVFEPILAAAIGGTSASSKTSPIRRKADPSRGGRQVDCLTKENGEEVAYEFKLRVTIAASGQGRWREELEFPVDCRASDHTPRLLVFDPTENEKLAELRAAFEDAGGASYVGKEAWHHLEERAGPAMGTFIERYLQRPLQDLLDETPEDLPKLGLSMGADSAVFTIGGRAWTVVRDLPDPGLTVQVDNDTPDA